MDLMSAIKRRFFGSVSISEVVGGVAIPAPPDAIDGRYAYSHNGYVSTCIGAIADAVGSVPLKLYREVQKDGDIDREEVSDHDLLRLLDMPSRHIVASMFWQQHQTEYELMGNVLWELVRSGPRIESINLIRGDDFVIHLNQDKTDIMFYEKRVNNKQQRVELEDAILFRTPNPFDNWRGVALGELVKAPLLTQYYIEQYNMLYFKEGAIPPGILTTEHNINEDQAKSIRERWHKEHSGKNSWHKIAVIGQGLKYDKLGESRKDMEFSTLADWSRETVLAVTGVPPVIAGVLKDASYANAMAQMRLFWQLTVLGRLHYIESVINHMLIPREYSSDIGLFVQFDLSGVEYLQEDQTQVATRSQIYVNSGIKTINEVRAEMNLPPVEWGDEPPNQGYSLDGLLGGSAPVQFKTTKKISDPERLKAWKAFDKKRVMRESKFAKIIRAYFKDQKKRLLAAIADEYELSKPGPDRTLDPERPVVPAEVLRLFLSEVEMLIMYEMTADEIKEFFALAGKEALKKLGVGVEFNVVDEEVVKWIESKVLNMVTTVNRASHDALKAILENSANENLTIAETSKEIGKLFDGFADYRSTRIARTEVISAHNAGAIEGYRQSDVVEGKEWLTAPGAENPRHELIPGLDGQVVALDAPFEVNGSLMMFPGDPSGPAEDVINCRCTVLPVLKDI